MQSLNMHKAKKRTPQHSPNLKQTPEGHGHSHNPKHHIPFIASPLDPKATAWINHKHESGNLTLKRRPTIAQFEADRVSGGIFRKQHEASTLELFFDLFFVANLAIFTTNHQHESPLCKSSICFFQPSLLTMFSCGQLYWFLCYPLVDLVPHQYLRRTVLCGQCTQQIFQINYLRHFHCIHRSRSNIRCHHQRWNLKSFPWYRFGPDGLPSSTSHPICNGSLVCKIFQKDSPTFEFDDATLSLYFYGFLGNISGWSVRSNWTMGWSEACCCLVWCDRGWGYFGHRHFQHMENPQLQAYSPCRKSWSSHIDHYGWRYYRSY